ncbi:hypothetical protein AO501_03820 [Mycobacterium gordonae]|uniref:Uncharacterized protein n=1 Tax=Mycobacterium gordonae TaxID=1778 RepID=A0A0Q2XDU1_MYCGO|nr:hypothetical protein AO501_03820 [Mycobacterium gordonae]
MRLLYGKYRYVAKITRVLDAENRTVVSEVGLAGEVYGRDQQDARKAAVDWARKWAEAQR